MYSISVPIIEDLLLYRTNEIVGSYISLCGASTPSVKAFISRNIDHMIPIVVSYELENILNETLGNSSGIPITREEFSKIKVLDLKDIDSSNINPVIFEYMLNLVELNLSSCNITEDFLSYLSTLTKLESLDLSNNNLILDLNKLPKTLIYSLHYLDVLFEQSEIKPYENVYTSLFDRNIITNKITDIEYEDYFYIINKKSYLNDSFFMFMHFLLYLVKELHY